MIASISLGRKVNFMFRMEELVLMPNHRIISHYF